MDDNASPEIDLTDERGVTIADLSRVLGVPMPTLRSWERRYGLPTLSRSSGRHRRYLPAEVHAVRLMRDGIARGQVASDAARTVRQLLDIEGPTGALVHRMLDAAERLDAPTIRAGLDEAVDMLGLAGSIDDVLLPVMRQIGIWWEVGHCDVAQERMATEAVRAWLDKRSAFAPTPTHSRPIVLSCGPRDLHTIGLEAMALLLRFEGWPCRVLGARTPTATVVTAAQATDAAAVVIVSQLATGRRAAVESIEAVDAVGVPVFYAGNSFTVVRSRVRLPGCYLGMAVGAASKLVLDTLA